MPTEVRLPDLGESVTHAKLTIWLKREGDRVVEGEPIAEVETDKTNVEISAPTTGMLLKIHVGEGTDRVAVNTVLAVLDDSWDRKGPTLPAPAPKEAEHDPSIESPLPKPAAQSDRFQLPSPIQEATAAIQADEECEAPEIRVSATALAKQMARAAGISLATVTGSGPGGRIVKSDIDALLQPDAETAAVRSHISSVTPPSDLSTVYDVRPLSPIRRVTAERLLHAKQTIPHFYLHMDCTVDRVLRMRDELNARSDEKLSLTIFVIRAAALALGRVPAANSTWVDGSIRVYKTADVALAVNTPAGLIAPVIRGAERKSLVALAHEVRALAARARSGHLKPEEYKDGTFSISNLGMYGVTSIYPIVNPPQSCILGVGAAEERPIVRDHQVAVGSVMTCTLSADHRVIDGATGAEFLGAFRQLIDDPWSLLL